MSTDRHTLASFDLSHPWRDDETSIDDEIRVLRRAAMTDSKTWRRCTLALHASDPWDRVFHRTFCAKLWNARRAAAIAERRSSGGGSSMKEVKIEGACAGLPARFPAARACPRRSR